MSPSPEILVGSVVASGGSVLHLPEDILRDLPCAGPYFVNSPDVHVLGRTLRLPARSAGLVQNLHGLR